MPSFSYMNHYVRKDNTARGIECTDELTNIPTLQMSLLAIGYVQKVFKMQ